ncbi:verprolin [Arabidopsis thaliana]|uniref:Verprolin n=1 Tax=Arabidopsis thaliana TaxID=3702 RepID=A0A1P8B2G6_ARATH|nr:verprolin [Arabidopsis thaliana]ANM63099.1 verprolin [Arabidopsis thaliana]|eukprot:NP_001325210.1 verprolin [Arabidopsis thaliana]
MCSNNNTSSGSYGELQLHDESSGSCRKKQKKDKVRRRGPGVAELEKIRLQEEYKPPLSSSPSLPNIDHHHHTLFAPASSVYDLVMTSPNFSFPEKLASTLPVFPISYGSLIPPAPIFQRSQHSLMMNLPNPSPGAGRFYQFIEPPSNQRSCVDSVSQFLEEENKKIFTAKKRPWPFLTDTTKPSVGPTTTSTIIRPDATQNRSMGITPVQETGTTTSNPIAIDSPTSIPRHYPRFIPLGLQVTKLEIILL